MLVPTFDDNVGIFINHRFNLTEVIRFDALLLSENELLLFYCLSVTKIGIIFDTMHVFYNIFSLFRRCTERCKCPDDGVERTGGDH